MMHRNAELPNPDITFDNIRGVSQVSDGKFVEFPVAANDFHEAQRIMADRSGAADAEVVTAAFALQGLGRVIVESDKLHHDGGRRYTAIGLLDIEGDRRVYGTIVRIEEPGRIARFKSRVLKHAEPDLVARISSVHEKSRALRYYHPDLLQSLNN